MSASLGLSTLLARSHTMCAAWRAALPGITPEDTDAMPLGGRLALDACALTLEHGQAIRDLVASGLQNPALALLRVQHEALLRAAWLLFAASDSAIRALGAPHTPATLKHANSLPLAHALLDDVERSNAPEALKRGLREFRDYSWAGVNSYAHAGLLPLGRVDSGHGEAQLVQAVQVSNAHTYSAHMIVAMLIDAAEGTANINVIAVSYPGCMLLK